MKPDIPLVLQDHANRLAQSILPKLSGFDANSVAMISAMMHMVAEAWDGAAARLIEENKSIRQLLGDAIPIVADAALKQRIAALAASADTDFTISGLERSNDPLRSALTALHAHVETLSAPDARGIEEAIWDELRRSVERRRVGLANF